MQEISGYSKLNMDMQQVGVNVSIEYRRKQCKWDSRFVLVELSANNNGINGTKTYVIFDKLD